jgi:hypothetical protein
LGIDENTAEMAWIFGWKTAHTNGVYSGLNID